ncbi:hypothetical protein SSOG_04899 [Streptomyces himastatinicus ATCC 53653]|uniref:Secreted protein n=1 Tax=Streptomyces himastatinicus ATCC 53653 TaxID=457427 RepID=D9WDC3_9ACTN|nr:hypothetical protein SSOG_04899 [Streptomyces himastatinicus ATCC 53653]
MPGGRECALCFRARQNGKRGIIVKNKIALAGAGIVLACSSAAFTASAATAAPAGNGTVAAADVDAAAAPPSCVKIKKYTTYNGYRSYSITNKCASTKKVKAIFKRAYDSSCTAIKPNKNHKFVPNVPIADWDKVVKC